MTSLDIPPFMSYGVSYALSNYRVANSAKGLEYDNLRLIRAFERGHDPKSSEAGFILTHVDMVKESSALVSGSLRILNSLENGQDRAEICDAYREMLAGLAKIEACMEGKLAFSSPPSFPDCLLLTWVRVRYVEELQAVRVPVVPRIHLWDYLTIHVPKWCCVRGCQRE
jgi:hypothetical protein